jgi:hypothetical protein
MEGAFGETRESTRISNLHAAGTPNRATPSALLPIHELNHQCIELLVRAAWSDSPDLPLSRQFQASLRNLNPESRLRAAHRAFLLVDIEFMNRDWWSEAHRSASKTIGAGRQGHFPKAAAVQLGRASISLLRHSIHTLGAEASLLGAHPAVLEIIASLSLSEIERLAERRFRDVRPRWEDRPALWQKLIQSAASPDIRLKRELDLTGLQLLVSDLR